MKTIDTMLRLSETVREPSKPPGPVFAIHDLNGGYNGGDIPLEMVKHRELGLFIGWQELEWVRAAIDEQAPVNIPKEQAKKYHIMHSPLHLAVEGDYEDVVPVLVEEGKADVDARAHIQPYFTPLQLAVAEGKTKMVEVLLQYGADPDLFVYFNDTASSILKHQSCSTLDLAKLLNHNAVVTVLNQFNVFKEQLQLIGDEFSCERDPDMPFKGQYITATCLGDKIFVGHQWGADQEFKSCIQIYNLITKTWYRIGHFDNREMDGYSLTTVKNQLLLIGGRWKKGVHINQWDSKEVLRMVSELTWRADLPQLNHGRIWFTCVSFSDYVVVAGGFAEKANERISSVEVLNFGHHSLMWHEICSFPIASSWLKSTVTTDKIFLGFGNGTSRSLYYTYLSEIKSSCVRKGNENKPESFWKTMPEPPLHWCGLGGFNDLLLTFGGENVFDTAHSDVHVFDWFRKEWRKISATGSERIIPAIVTSNVDNKQEIFVLGGEYKDEGVKTVERCLLYK